jgi:hypothetical protein
MKKIGKILILLFFINPQAMLSQCIGMEGLVSFYEFGSYTDQSDYRNSGEVSSIPYTGYSIALSCDKYYGPSTDMIYCLSNDIVVWECTLECFNRIRSTVVKEVGGKVIDNGITQENGFVCESYVRVGKSYTIEFHKNVSLGTYSVVLLSESRQREIREASDLLKRQLEIENQADIYLSDIRASQESGDINSSDRSLTIAKKYFANNSVSNSKKVELEQLERLCKNSKLSDCKRKVEKELKANKFEKALQITNSYNSQDADFTNYIKSLQQEITEAAVTYFTKRCDDYKAQKELKKSLCFADSVLLFDGSSSYAKQRRAELLSILSFLDQRKSTEFDFWLGNESNRIRIIDDYTKLVLSKKTESTGVVNFRIDFTSDTTCALNSKLDWISDPIEGVYFGEKEIYKYDLTAYQQFDYCAKSRGSLNLNISWIDRTNKEKCYQGGFENAASVDSDVKYYLSRYYPYASGKVSYKESIVQVNGKEHKDVSIMKFHTRGPWNAVYSFLLPGSGLLINSYGHRGYGPLLLYAAGVGAIVSNDDNLITAGALAIATSVIWDFSATFSLGVKNLRNSKSLRNKLKQSQIVL